MRYFSVWLQSCVIVFSYSPVLSAVDVCLLAVVSYSPVFPESGVNVCLFAVVSYSLFCLSLERMCVCLLLSHTPLFCLSLQ